ncbi:alpha/beta fold hydrolase [Alteromonas gilva]|uniref:Alpha/beta hydrolase n=1 Tax=Alteromonas gilva TaxID=2987522 RepID=A0ABT5KYN7_9ALTE|nr:alpha/beta hydrolase [Alteromonas gilva]MDC8829757.1 alpha/beta hydrolase [Alteromonas gilva]
MRYVFLPGTLCDERVWLPIWKQLSLPSRAYVPLQWANSLDEMLALTTDRTDPDGKSHLIGHSMGGYIAALWALTFPQKVASLTILGYAPGGLSEAELQRRQQLLRQLATGKVNVTAQGYLQNMLLAPHQETLLPVLTDMADDLGSATLKAHIQSTTPRKDLTAPLSQLDCPVRLVAARQDTVAPLPAMQAACKQINGAELTIIENSGHMMLLEQPKAVAELLETLVSPS